MTNTKTTKPIRTFRVLAGVHHQADRDYKFTEEEIAFSKETGRPLRRPSKTYSAGDIVESEVDLVALLGATKMQEVRRVGPGRKVQAVTTVGETEAKVDQSTEEGTAVQEISDEGDVVVSSEEGDFAAVETKKKPDLERMNVAQIKEYAASEEIDIGDCHTKREMIAQINLALKAK